MAKPFAYKVLPNTITFLLFSPQQAESLPRFLPVARMHLIKQISSKFAGPLQRSGGKVFILKMVLTASAYGYQRPARHHECASASLAKPPPFHKQIPY